MLEGFHCASATTDRQFSLNFDLTGTRRNLNAGFGELILSLLSKLQVMLINTD